MRKFFTANRKVCERVKRFLPQARMDIFACYERQVARYVNSKPDQIVVDVGGGQACAFAKHLDSSASARIVAVDISYEEMMCNNDVDEKRVANVVQDLPFGNEEVDLVVSRTVLEHLADLDGFLANAERVLKKGGYTIHLFPSRFAPFALINQALPNSLARRVLFFLFPERREVAGFPAYYDKCYYSGAKNALEERGFDVVETHVSYYQSDYFNFLVPLFLASALYELFIRSCRVKNLCAFVLIVAKKKANVPTSGGA